MISDDERATIKRLDGALGRDKPGLDRVERYYEGQQLLETLGLAVPPELARFTTIVNWPAMAADGIDDRLDVEGFRFPGSDKSDDTLWGIWQLNNLDEESQLAHLDSLIFGRSYICVGTNEVDPSAPLVTVESPYQVIHETDARTRRVTSAWRRFTENTAGVKTVMGTLYTPDATVWVEWRTGGWTEVDRDPHNLHVVPVVPVLNRPRTSKRHGVSEMERVISLTDAAARSLTNLQLAQETHAVPQRGVLGASKGDFVDSNGKALTVWEAYFGAVWALENPAAKTFQFEASDLKNFDTTLNLYARLASGTTCLPPNYFGLSADDAASADAIRSREARLVKLCERKHRPLSGSWETTNRIVLKFAGASKDVLAKAQRLETLWRDPATPTRAQQADATVKLVQTGILPREGAWEDLGYSAERQNRLREQFAAQDAADPLGVLTRSAQQPPAA